MASCTQATSLHIYTRQHVFEEACPSERLLRALININAKRINNALEILNENNICCELDGGLQRIDMIEMKDSLLIRHGIITTMYSDITVG